MMIKDYRLKITSYLYGANIRKVCKTKLLNAISKCNIQT